MKYRLSLACLLLGLTAMACGSDDAGVADALPDAAVEVAGTDVLPDAVGDEGEDGVAADVSSDAESDAMADAGAVDAEPTHEDVVDAAPAEPWPACDPARMAGGSLAEKAAEFDRRAWELHVHPQLKYILPATLKEATDEASATWQDVAAWHADANDGLWNALYMASQVYRYAVTREAEVLAHLTTLLEGEQQRMAITGVQGMFTRTMIPPDFPGLSCPSNLSAYTPDVEKDDDKWVRVDSEGCVEVVSAESGEWTQSEHCGLDAFKGWCWKDNVSQDEYAGHVYALGLAARLLDDDASKDARAMATTMLSEVGSHLLSNDLSFIDWDGRPTEHGRIFTPIMALAFVKTAAEASDRADLKEWYRKCLRQLDGGMECAAWLPAGILPFDDVIDFQPLYLGADGCKSNWNGISMSLAAFAGMFWFEDDEELTGRLRGILNDSIFFTADSKSLQHEKNPWYTFMWVDALAPPSSDVTARQLVEDAMCSLADFPASRAHHGMDASDKYEQVCTSRLDNPFSAEIIAPSDRCPRRFMWWFPPYKIEVCSDQPLRHQPPSDYLLAYWLGRYLGVISPDA